MKTQSVFPKTKEDKRLEKKVSEMREKINNIIISPFNGKKWSKI